MQCPRCGAELVEVDNPIRREVRHKRGTECKPKERSYPDERALSYDWMD